MRSQNEAVGFLWSGLSVVGCIGQLVHTNSTTFVNIQK